MSYSCRLHACYNLLSMTRLTHGGISLRRQKFVGDKKSSTTSGLVCTDIRARETGVMQELDTHYLIGITSVPADFVIQF